LSTSIERIAFLNIEEAATRVEKRTIPEIASVFERRALGVRSKRKGFMQ
jgi:hypothetical protein